MVDIKEVFKSFGKKKVLKGISFNIEKGKISGLIGANGTGKTTLMKIMVGLDHLDSGSISYDGIDLRNKDKLNIGFMIEEPVLPTSFWLLKSKLDCSLYPSFDKENISWALKSGWVRKKNQG